MFGRATNTTGFVPYVGDDFSILLPSRWVPSRERDFDRQGLATLLRYEDNFDTSNHLMVLTKDTSAKAVTDLGDEVSALLRVPSGEVLKRLGAEMSELHPISSSLAGLDGAKIGADADY